MKQQTEQQIEAIHEMIAQQNLSKKEHLNMRDAAKFLGVSTSYLYKKSSRKESIPFYRLGKKLIYYKREDLQKFLESNRQNTCEEIALNAELSITQKKEK